MEADSEVAIELATFLQGADPEQFEMWVEEPNKKCREFWDGHAFAAGKLTAKPSRGLTRRCGAGA